MVQVICLSVRHVQGLEQQRLGVRGGWQLLEVPLHHQTLEAEGMAGSGHAQQPRNPVQKQNTNLKMGGNFEHQNCYRLAQDCLGRLCKNL